MVIEAYRGHRLTGYQVRELLGMSTLDELDGVLKKHHVWLDYSIEDLQREGSLRAASAKTQRGDPRTIRRPGPRRMIVVADTGPPHYLVFLRATNFRASADLLLRVVI
jgi:hypothetical protein